MARKKKVTDKRISVEELKKYLLLKIDTTNQVDLDKVDRFIELTILVRQLHDNVKAEGATIVVENGSQRYIKQHPAISEINKINSTLLSIEKSFNFREVTDGFDESDFI